MGRMHNNLQAMYLSCDATLCWRKQKHSWQQREISTRASARAEGGLVTKSYECHTTDVEHRSCRQGAWGISLVQVRVDQSSFYTAVRGVTNRKPEASVPLRNFTTVRHD